jgi:hypothetical protein
MKTVDKLIEEAGDLAEAADFPESRGEGCYELALTSIAKSLVAIAQSLDELNSEGIAAYVRDVPEDL